MASPRPVPGPVPTNALIQAVLYALSGILIAVTLKQPTKALLPMVGGLILVNVIVCSPVQPLNALSPIVAKEFGNVTDCSPVQ